MELYSACKNGNLEIVKELLKHTNYDNLIILGYTPLHRACSYGHLEIVKELLKHLSHDDLIIQDNYGDTPLHYACDNGYTEIVKELLPRLSHEDLIIQNEDGETPLHNACYYYYEHLEIVKKLLKYLNHDDLIIHNKNGETPLHHVCFSDNLDIVKLLILNGLPIIDFPKHNAFMKVIKWSKYEHKNVMIKKTRLNMQMVFMVYCADMMQKV